MHITIINDCKDENAKGRQVTRAQALFSAPVGFVGVRTDLEAAGNLIDILDAARGSEHIVLVNVAPRAKKSWWLQHDFPQHTNGTPFCYVRIGDALVLASVDGYTLSLVKKLRLASQVQVIDYQATTTVLAERGLIAQEDVDDVLKTQFRSFNFLPRVARVLSEGTDVPATTLPITDIPDVPAGPWYADNFGNVKTTILASEVVGATHIELNGTRIPFFPRLSNIPDGTLGAAIGSSGYGNERFVEVFVQGGSAERELGL